MQKRASGGRKWRREEWEWVWVDRVIRLGEEGGGEVGLVRIGGGEAGKSNVGRLEMEKRRVGVGGVDTGQGYPTRERSRRR